MDANDPNVLGAGVVADSGGPERRGDDTLAKGDLGLSVGAPEPVGFGSVIVPKIDVGVELVVEASPSEVGGMPKLGVLVPVDEDPDMPKIEVVEGLFPAILGEASGGFAENAELLPANIDGDGASFSPGVASLLRDPKMLGTGFCVSEGVLA